VNSISAYIPEKKCIDVPFNKSEINQDWSLLLDLDEKIIECFDLDTMDKVLIFNDRPVLSSVENTAPSKAADGSNISLSEIPFSGSQSYN
jgi:hypothetical protein